jgi:tetratricopeptide (TPR) repeat protein
MRSALIILLLAASAAGGDDARAHFQRGQALFADARYREALGEFEAANQAAPVEVADLYFNIGQCHRNLGQPREAVTAFERYLELRPDAGDRKSLRALIARLRSKLPPEPASRERRPGPSPEALPILSASGAPATAPVETKAEAEALEGASEPQPQLQPPRAEARTERPAASVQPSGPAPVDLALAPRAAVAPDVSAATPGGQTSTTPTPVYREWWFWTAGGAATVATVLIVVAVSHHDTRVGSLDTIMGSAGTFDTRGR